jgi:hypothetical protein
MIKEVIKRITDKISKLFRNKYKISFMACILLSMPFIVSYFTPMQSNAAPTILKNQISEAGYIVNKTDSCSFHYIITDGVANPEFYEEFFYTVFVDDNYVKIKVPYKVYTQYNLGDHLTVNRDYNKTTGEYSDYNVVIYDIEVPATIVNDDYIIPETDTITKKK